MSCETTKSVRRAGDTGRCATSTFLQPTANTPCLRVRQEKMSTSIGDGMATLGVAAVIICYLYFTHQSRQKRLEIIHQERLAAMEKGIPLPEFPAEPVKRHE